MALPEPLTDTAALAAPLLAELEAAAGKAGAAVGDERTERLGRGSTASPVARSPRRSGRPRPGGRRPHRRSRRRRPVGAVLGRRRRAVGRTGDPCRRVGVGSDRGRGRSGSESGSGSGSDGGRRHGHLPRSHPPPGYPPLGPHARHPGGLRPRRRGGHPTAQRPGRRRRRCRAAGPHRQDGPHGRRVRQGAPPVRRAHRELPGRQAPVGRRPGGPGVRPPGGLRRSLVPGRARHPTPPGPPRPPRPTPPTPRSRRRGSPCRSTGPSATPGSATSTCSSSGPGRCPSRGDQRPTTGAGCSSPSSATAESAGSVDGRSASVGGRLRSLRTRRRHRSGPRCSSPTARADRGR